MLRGVNCGVEFGSLATHGTVTRPPYLIRLARYGEVGDGAVVTVFAL